MKHAGPTALARLEGLLTALRGRPGLIERRSGVFYRGGQAFLHFHEDPAGLFADFRPGEAWERWPVTDEAQRARLIAAIDRALALERQSGA